MKALRLDGLNPKVVAEEQRCRGAKFSRGNVRYC